MMKLGFKAGRKTGFTLLELVIVLAIVSMLAALTTPSIMNEINERRAKVSIQETQMIVDAARSYRIDNGVWPGNATCSNALDVFKTTSPPLLPSISNVNKYNSPYTTSCTAKTFSVDQNLVEDWAGYFANSVAGTEIVSAVSSLVRTTIGIPGSEPALDAKLSRLATGNAELNRMRTALLLGGNNIQEVNNISTVSMDASGTVQAGSIRSLGSAVIDGMLYARSESQFDKTATFKEALQISKVVIEDTRCSGSGNTAMSNSGTLLTCQSGKWSPQASIKQFSTKHATVDASCARNDPTNPAGYDFAMWAIVCGNRFCTAVDQGYKFGVIVESDGGNGPKPWGTAPNANVLVSCAK